ncbi:MAG TPA: sugar transferase, partial [Gemmatimonadales bacterium]|nr:sugar transferase [Gemmatimonadales bacterium]
MRRTLDVMRWMEALVDRPDATSVHRAPDVWTVDAARVPAPEEVDASPSTRWPTRTLNFVLALLAIVSLLPVFVLLAVLVKLTSRGPVFYLQERVGLDRRTPGPGAHNHRRSQD